MRLVCVCVYVLKWYFIWVLDYRNLMSIEPSICIHLYWEFWHHECTEHIAIRSDSQNWFRTSTGTSCTWGSKFSYLLKFWLWCLNPINDISNKWYIPCYHWCFIAFYSIFFGFQQPAKSGGVGENLNVGFFATRPDRRLLEAALIFARRNNFSREDGWGHSGWKPRGYYYVGGEVGEK